jgi:hypothetical protein
VSMSDHARRVSIGLFILTLQAVLTVSVMNATC